MQGIQMRKYTELRKANVQSEETRVHWRKPAPVVKVVWQLVYHARWQNQIIVSRASKLRYLEYLFHYTLGQLLEGLRGTKNGP